MYVCMCHAVFTDCERQDKIFDILGKKVRWDRQNLFVIAEFVIAGFVSTYFTVIQPGFYMLFVITGSSL